MAEISIPAGPLEDCPSLPFAPARERRLMDQALEGVELGAYDRRIVDWLADWDVPTVATIASLIARVRDLPPADRIVLDRPEELGISWPDGGDFLALTGDTITITPRGLDVWEMDAAEAREWSAQLAAMAEVLAEREAAAGREGQ